MWSALKRQQSTNLTEFDANLQWRSPGTNAYVKIQRSVTEILTYGLAGVLPWFGKILPAVRFESPFNYTSKVEMVIVGGITDIFLDLQQCSIGRDEESGPDGYYDACFPSVPGRSAARNLCFMKGIQMRSTTRIRDFPSPGHERWSCSDHFVMEQLVAAQVLDYFISHGDRFYGERTNNLFFSSTEGRVKFVSIDHEGGLCKFFRVKEYEDYVSSKELLKYQLPLELRDDLKNVAMYSSKDEFVKTLNTTLDGQFDNLNRVIKESFHTDACKPEEEDPRDLGDILWERLESVARFYKFTIGD